jgi:hypothetical protein
MEVVMFPDVPDVFFDLIADLIANFVDFLHLLF